MNKNGMIYMNRSDRNTPVNATCDRHDCEMCRNQKECVEYISERIMKENMEVYKRLAEVNQWSI